jgi:hypothetical protein
MLSTILQDDDEGEVVDVEEAVESEEDLGTDDVE